MTARPPILSFLGGAGTVTGSRFLLESGERRVLVDCGLYQGTKELRLRNWAPFPLEASSLDAVVVSHAHVDHVGYLPRLVREGFDGPVYATPGTVDLAKIVLPDSAHLQEEDAARANRMGWSRHHPALPLYTAADATSALGHLVAVSHDTPIEVAAGVEVELFPAGHILGSAITHVRLDGRASIVFSGDLGRPHHPLLRPPAPPPVADVLVVESTYGGRSHDDATTVEQLAEVIVTTAGRGGTVIVPAFAVDRTEIVLFHLSALMRTGAIPELPVFVDSPMALASLRVYERAVAERWPELRPELFDAGDPFDTGTIEEVRDVERSLDIDQMRVPSIVVSASGMASGGRVLHHLAARLPDPRNSVVLVGFQAAGTRGRALADGARHVKLLGQYVPVRADVVELPALSVHADAGELTDWVGAVEHVAPMVYAVHGEPLAAQSLCDRLVERFGSVAVAARHLERVVVQADRTRPR